MATVELEGLTKHFGSFVALARLDLSVEDGEFLVLLGPSGCGKSTTMRLIAGLDEPTAGDIRIDGRRVNDRPARDRDLAMVFQNYALYPHMTVAENIGYPLKVRRVPREERRRRAREAAVKVHLEAQLARRPAELSGGQRQRVALARAIVRRPQLFLMDEPLSNLDARLRTAMRAELKHLQRELGVTTIYVTHDQVEAMTLADRIVILEQARIQQVATPATTYARPANVFVAGFIGSPPMNLIPGEIADGVFEHASGRIALPTATAPGPVTLGVRPEHMRVTAVDRAAFVGEVYSWELLGDHALLGVMLDATLVSVKLDPQAPRGIGEPIGLLPEDDKLHLFDGRSGDRREVAS